MRGRAIEVEVVFLDVLPVIALAVRQSEQAFLEDRIATVPERKRKAEKLLFIADTGETILTPVIRAGPSLIMAADALNAALGSVTLAELPHCNLNTTES